MADFVIELDAPIAWFAELLNEEMPGKKEFMQNLKMSNTGFGHTLAEN